MGHIYDPYTSKLVDHLVAWLLETGCTVIVLSATLTARRRAQLVGAVGASEPQPSSSAYPLITKVVSGQATSHPVHDPSIRAHCVRLEHLSAEANPPWSRIAEAARNGACVLVIRNTVALAQETYCQIKNSLCGDGLHVGLLHSRYPHFQRQENEAEWMRLLGKDHSQRPDGCILVATQIVEQSVDIDADLLITDLAPTDLMLQRIGRLHRHERPRPAGFEQPICWILHPTVDWNEDTRLVKAALGPSAYVYPPFALYQAGRVWKERHTVNLPAEIRTLLEEGERNADSLPAGAAAWRDELETLTATMFQAGSRQDPFHQPSVEDTEGAQTRWNLQPSALLVLLREPPVQVGREITVTPLHGEPVILDSGFFSYDLAKLLHENAARVPAHVVAKAFAGMPDWLGRHIHSAVIAICRPDSMGLEILGSENHSCRIEYSTLQGISYQRTPDVVIRPPDDEFDSWF